MMQMNAPTPEGGQMPMMVMVGMVVGSKSITVGWLYHLFNSAVIGAIFGWLFGNLVTSIGRGLTWGALHGIGWWILGRHGQPRRPSDLRPDPGRALCRLHANRETGCGIMASYI